MPAPAVPNSPLIVLTGKGGVGKTLVSCALARARARRGVRVLLLELDARESLHRFLGCEPSGGAVLTVEANLDVQNLRPREVVDRLIDERVRPSWVAKRLRSSVIYEQFVQGAPGLREAASLGHAVRCSQGRKGQRSYDLVLLDAPATGHGVALLEAPRLLAEAIGKGPVAELAQEVSQHLADPAACGFWAVSTAEGMALRETVELDAALAERLGRSLDILLLNRLLPAEVPPAADPAAKEPAWLAPWRRRAATQQARITSLAADWDRPLVRLPLSGAEGPQALDDIEAALVAAGLA